MSNSPDRSAFLARLGAALWWPFGRVRPQLWSALGVLYFGALALCTGAMGVLVKIASGEPAGLDFELLGYIVGSAGVGSLVSAPLMGSDNVMVSTWLRITLFGAISGLVFGLIVEIEHGPPIDVSDYCLSALLAAVLFPLVRWLASKGS